MGTGGLFLRKIRATVADEPTGFVWLEEKRIAGSGYPASRGQLEWVRLQGIDAVITLTESPLPRALQDGMPMTFDHVPMADHRGPSFEELDGAVSVLQTRLGEGRKVMVHCLAGEGRTGCVLAAYVIRVKRLGAAEALEAVREVKHSFVEWPQEKSVYEFAARNGPGQSG